MKAWVIKSEYGRYAIINGLYGDNLNEALVFTTEEMAIKGKMSELESVAQVEITEIKTIEVFD